MIESVLVPSWARYSWDPFLFLRCSAQSRCQACSCSGDTRGRDRGRVSEPCQAALRNRTDGHAVDQGLSLEQAHWWPHYLQLKGLSRVFSSPTVQKCLLSLQSNCHIHT